MVRPATIADADTIARLVNAAYQVESFFVAGDRTSPEAVREAMQTGAFLIAEVGGAVAGCVYVEIRGARGYFGMLAVDPSIQGRGIGRALIGAAEQRAREAGARYMEITVVNLRRELFAFYGRLGYVPIGTEPYVDRSVLRRCHFVRMWRPLVSEDRP